MSPLAMIETKQRTEHSLTLDEWKTYLDPEGRVTNVDKLKLKIYQAVGASGGYFLKRQAKSDSFHLGHPA